MSKRAGTFVTLSDVIDAVGSDVIRFMMLTRRNDQPLEFDYAKVTEKVEKTLYFIFNTLMLVQGQFYDKIKNH